MQLSFASQLWGCPLHAFVFMRILELHSIPSFCLDFTSIPHTVCCQGSMRHRLVHHHILPLLSFPLPPPRIKSGKCQPSRLPASSLRESSGSLLYCLCAVPEVTATVIAVLRRSQSRCSMRRWHYRNTYSIGRVRTSVYLQ